MPLPVGILDRLRGRARESLWIFDVFSEPVDTDPLSKVQEAACDRVEATLLFGMVDHLRDASDPNCLST